MVSDTFTPTNPASASVPIGSTGSIIDYSVWLSIYGAKTTGAAAAKNGGEGLKERCGEYLIVSVVVGFVFAVAVL